MLLLKKIFPTALLFVSIIILFSCKGQRVTETSEIEVNRAEMGLDFNEEIWSIYQDGKNNYWFGSNGKGVFYYDGETVTNFTKEDGLLGSQIRGIQEDKLGNIYFDTPDGFSKYDGTNFTILKPIYSPGNEWKSEADDLWFKGDGNRNGVYRYDGESLFHLTFPEKDLKKVFGLDLGGTPYSPYGPYSIYKDKKGNLWFGTLSAGVYRYDGDSFLWIAEKELTVLEDGRVPGIRSVIEDKDGNFWLSNILNRYRIKEVEGKTIGYEKLDGIKESKRMIQIQLPYFTSAVKDDTNGDLWIQTYAEGVWKYDGVKLLNYRIKEGRKQLYLYSIYKDNEGLIWLSTEEGLYKYNGNNFEKFKP